jgi:hypothetical protein
VLKATWKRRWWSRRLLSAGAWFPAKRDYEGLQTS